VKKAVLFDLDDTLYEYEPVHKKALAEVYKIFNTKIMKISREKFTRLFNLSKTEIHQELSGTASSHNRILYFQRLIEKTHNTVDPKIILKLYYIYWGTFLNNMKLKKGVLETLKKLKKQDLKIVLVSDLTTNIQLKKIGKLRITPYIDYLVTSEEAGSEKPHLIMFLLALKKINMLPEDAIFVGDSKSKDISGANAAGIDTVWVTNKKGKLKRDKQNYSLPDYYVKSIPQILNILENLKGER
jgi:HAD superfamily hydrolase (TIGR02253 family)